MPATGVLALFDEARVQPVVRQEFFVTAEFGDAAVIEHDDLVGVAHGAEPMRDHQQGAVVGEFGHRFGDRGLGVHVERVRIVSIVVVAVLTCAAVAFAGIIAFVGLIVPHLMRMVIGPADRPLLAAGALGGALLLVLADLFARTAVPMADLPIGMLTSLVGGPFFFWLLRRTRKRSGGWG